MLKKYDTSKINFLIQASSISWSGEPDFCMNLINNKPVIYWTIKKIFDCFGDVKVTVIAPTFDKNGELNKLKKYFKKEFKIYYGNSSSPLKRMLNACKGIDSEDIVCRIDSMHLFFDADAIKKMLLILNKEKLDCIKFPDDFPVQFTSELYRVGALRKLRMLLKDYSSDKTKIHEVHPRFLLMRRREFITKYLKINKRYSDEIFLEARKIAKQIYIVPRTDVNVARLPSGDQFSYHYNLSKKFLSKKDTVLDIACGGGHGSRIISSNVKSLTCADYDKNSIECAAIKYRCLPNVNFIKQNLKKLTFGNETFDVVISMETIEHIDNDKLCISEMARVLKPNGLLLISTPQNSMGRIPVNPFHFREYSLKNFIQLIKSKFDILKIIGIKAGLVYFHDDPIGTNTFIVAKKK